jgi:hypothetical protein
MFSVDMIIIGLINRHNATENLQSGRVLGRINLHTIKDVEFF